MIIRRFLLWARTAPAGQRAEAVGALARAFLYSDMSDDDRWEAETALTAMLDDPSILVRRALAEAIANAPAAPRHLVVALASDQAEIANLILGRSPVLADFDLVDCAAVADDAAQAAIARRPGLSAVVSAAIAEIGCRHAIVALAQNHDALITDAGLARMVDRFGHDGTVREAILARPDVPVAIRQAVAAALSASLSAFVTDCGWLTPERSNRVAREARDKATVALARAEGVEDTEHLVAYLRNTSQLTPALILRALLSRRTAFAVAAFADLSGLPGRRVASILADRRGSGFASLYARTGLPDLLRPAFAAAFAALRERARPGPDGDENGRESGRGLSRHLVERVRAACEILPADQAGRLLAMLRRFEAEAARDDARDAAGALADDAALSIVMRYAPGELAA